jgi:tetratricopeptide (TPR) repeat protein
MAQVCYGAGQLQDAEAYARQAIAMGEDLALPARELVRLSYSLGDTLFWQGRFDEIIRIGESGLALLGPDDESVEAALMNDLIFMAYFWRDDHELAHRFALRIATFIQRLPYAEELRSAYDDISRSYYVGYKDVEAARRWLGIFKEQATQHHDLRALSEIASSEAGILLDTGDPKGAISRAQDAVALCRQIGDTKEEGAWLMTEGFVYGVSGQLEEARETLERARELIDATNSDLNAAVARYLLGWLALARDDPTGAEAYFQTALTSPPEALRPWVPILCALHLGRVCLARGQPEDAVRHFGSALTQAYASGNTDLETAPATAGLFLSGAALSGLEEVSASTEGVRVALDQLRQDHPDTRSLPLVPWLEPATTERFAHQWAREEFSAPLSPDWRWHDPFGDCAHVLGQGLQMRAANLRELGAVNVSAPRLLRSVPAGDFAAQTACGPVSDQQPGIGGLVLWQDEDHYIVLERGRWGAADIIFRSHLDREDSLIGRGRLRAERIWLRLERQGAQVQALCSSDGRQWFGVGALEFPLREGEQIGLHAIGLIDRTIYHGAFPEGTAIQFACFDVWTAEAD